jgi:hypothetical protein
MSRIVASVDPHPFRPRSRIIYEAIDESTRRDVQDALEELEPLEVER